MDIKDFAEYLNGREYGYPQFASGEVRIAKDNGFVIVYGASDDLIEFEGAICDEGGCFDGGRVYFNCDGVCQDEEEKKNYPNWIEALWCEDSIRDDEGGIITWTYRTDIPHETFMIYDEGEPYCRAIVFSINDLKEA